MSSIIKGVLKEEYERLKRLIESYKKEIQKYHKGSISIKKRRGRPYAYLAYWKNGSVHFKYLGLASADKVKKIGEQIKARRKCESLLKEAKIYFKEVSKVTHGGSGQRFELTREKKGLLLIRPGEKTASKARQAELKYDVARALSFSPAERFNQLNKFLKLAVAFREDKMLVPVGVFKFKTFEEADKWRFQVTTGQNPGCQQ